MTVLSLIADRKVICEYFCAELFLRGKEKMKLKVVFFQRASFRRSNQSFSPFESHAGIKFMREIN